MVRSSFPPARRRRSPVKILLIILAVLLAAFLVYLSFVDTEVPTRPIEQDVTNALLAH